MFNANSNYHTSDGNEKQGDSLHHKLNLASNCLEYGLSNDRHTKVNAQKCNYDNDAHRPDKKIPEKSNQVVGISICRSSN